MLKYVQEEFMITSGSVGGIYIYPEMTEELIEEALKRSANRYEIVVTRELLQQGPCILSPFNNKRGTAFWKWADEHPDIVAKKMAERGKPESWLRTLRTKRHVPFWLSSEAFPASQFGREVKFGKEGNGYYDPFYYAPKPDKYGLPWGKIEEHDKTESERLRKLYQTRTMQQLMADGAKFGDTDVHYADIRFLYELVEETGYLAVRERKDERGLTMYLPDGETPIYDSLFERLVTLYQFDRDHPDDTTVDHEVYFFWVKEVIGKLNEEGAPGETEPPEILPIMSLTRRNFYQKHAHGVMILLDKLIKEHGMVQYTEALKYLQREFSATKLLRREPYIKIPTLDMTDAEMWNDLVKDVKPLK